MEKNKFSVQKKQWRKWPETARAVFNEVYWMMKCNQDLFIAPKQEKTKEKAWSVTAWNAAWIAASAVDKQILQAKMAA